MTDMKKLNPCYHLPGIALLLICISCSREVQTVSLTTLDLSKMVQGWGNPQINKSVTGKPLTIAGRFFETGVGTHAASRIDLNLRRKAERFTAYSGVDDGAAGFRGSIEFSVSGDGEGIVEIGTDESRGQCQEG